MATTQDWVVIIPEDLDDYLLGAGMVALRTKALAAGQIDPFTNTMNTVTNRIRAEIAKLMVLSDTDNAVPLDLKWCACVLILEQMHARIPTLRLIDNYQEILKDARDYLKRVNAGKVWVAAPSDPAAVPYIQSEVAPVVIRSSTRQCTASTMAGI